MYKVHNNVSQYLKEAMHCKVNNMSTHNIRNRENYTLPEYRLEVYKKSFIQDAVSKWNLLLLNQSRPIQFTFS